METKLMILNIDVAHALDLKRCINYTVTIVAFV